MTKRGPGGPLQRATSMVLAALTVEVVLLAVTGVALYFVYRPFADKAWNDVRITTSGVGFSHLMRITHRVLGYLAVQTAVVAAVLVALRSAGSRRWIGPLLGVGLAVTSAVALYTGYLLPWDQLALWAVTVGTNMTGYAPILGDQVRFVISRNTELTPGTVITWLVVHVGLGGPVAGLLLGAAWRRHRRAAHLDTDAHPNPAPGAGGAEPALAARPEPGRAPVR